MFRMGKPVPGLEPSKLSEPMWTLFFELHTGHVAQATITGLTHDRWKRHADKSPSQESPCKTGGIHTRPAPIGEIGRASCRERV